MKVLSEVAGGNTETADNLAVWLASLDLDRYKSAEADAKVKVNLDGTEYCLQAGTHFKWNNI